jgi:hypothetical protein
MGSRASKGEVREAIRLQHEQMLLLKDALTADDAAAAVDAFIAAAEELEAVGELLASRYPDEFEDEDDEEEEVVEVESGEPS